MVVHRKKGAGLAQTTALSTFATPTHTTGICCAHPRSRAQDHGPNEIKVLANQPQPQVKHALHRYTRLLPAPDGRPLAFSPGWWEAALRCLLCFLQSRPSAFAIDAGTWHADCCRGSVLCSKWCVTTIAESLLCSKAATTTKTKTGTTPPPIPTSSLMTVPFIAGLPAAALKCIGVGLCGSVPKSHPRARVEVAECVVRMLRGRAANESVTVAMLGYIR